MSSLHHESGHDGCLEQPPPAVEAVAHRRHEHAEAVGHPAVSGPPVCDDEQLVQTPVTQVECRPRPALQGHGHAMTDESHPPPDNSFGARERRPGSRAPLEDAVEPGPGLKYPGAAADP